jgi:hypothetical protein
LINDNLGKIDAVVEAQEAAAAEAFHAAQLKASEIAKDIAQMIHDKHPGVHPAVVSMALTNSVASLVALFAQGNVVKAVGTLSTLHDQTRQTALRLMDNLKKQRATPDAKAN